MAARTLPGLTFPHSSLLRLLTPHASIPASLRPVIPGVSAEPKLRHSARSRGIHASHHARIDAATTRSMTACAGQRCPHITHTIPYVIPVHLTRLYPSSEFACSMAPANGASRSLRGTPSCHQQAAGAWFPAPHGFASHQVAHEQATAVIPRTTARPRVPITGGHWRAARGMCPAVTAYLVQAFVQAAAHPAHCRTC